MEPNEFYRPACCIANGDVPTSKIPTCRYLNVLRFLLPLPLPPTHFDTNLAKPFLSVFKITPSTDFRMRRILMMQKREPRVNRRCLSDNLQPDQRWLTRAESSSHSTSYSYCWQCFRFWLIMDALNPTSLALLLVHHQYHSLVYRQAPRRAKGNSLHNLPLSLHANTIVALEHF